MLRAHRPYNGMCTALLLVPKLWTCRNGMVGTVGRPLAPLAGHWHTIFFPDADPWHLMDAEQIDSFAAGLTEVFNLSNQTVSKPDCPWWTPECQDAYNRHLVSRSCNTNSEPTIETREFHTTIQKAKRAYWKHIIDRVSNDKSLYKVVGWHKPSSNLKLPPLKVNSTMVEDTMEKAEALRSVVLEHFSAEDDLNYDPLQVWDRSGNLNWKTDSLPRRSRAEHDWCLEHISRHRSSYC